MRGLRLEKRWWWYPMRRHQLSSSVQALKNGANISVEAAIRPMPAHRHSLCFMPTAHRRSPFSTMSESGIYLAKVVKESTVSFWSDHATTTGKAVYTWSLEASAKVHRDNDTLALTQPHPQSGNPWAVVSGLNTSAEQSANVSADLAARRGPEGAPAPEAGRYCVSDHL